MNALQVAQHCFDNWNGPDADAIVATFADGETYSGPTWGQALLGEGLVNYPEEPDRNRNREPNMKARRKYLAVAALAFAVVQVCADLAAHAQSVLREPVFAKPSKIPV